MLDGRVLEVSQVEYKPFGKPPLQREIAGMQGFPEYPCIEIPPGFLAIRLISSIQVPIQVPLVFTFLPRQAAIRA